MRLLILTQKVDQNHDVLGFFHRWIEEFAKHLEGVTIIALGVGEYNLPKNVRVFSLGKERGTSRLGYVWNFYRLIWRERKNYDVVFVHMNQEYVVLGALLWKLFGKRVGLWYVHRAKTFSLWIAEKLANVIFTSTKESFTISTNKCVYLGHGIDIDACRRPALHKEKREERALLCVGRLTPIKDQETVIRACGILAQRGILFTCTFVGAPSTGTDTVYYEKLKNLVVSEGVEDKVVFKGKVAQRDLFRYYWKSDIHINACPIGGLDKVVIEGMIGGAIPLVANEAFRDSLGEYSEELVFRLGNAEDLARRIQSLIEVDNKEKIRNDLQEYAEMVFDLSILIKKIINSYETS